MMCSSVGAARGGFYTSLVHPGLRIISLNMNLCNNQNWYAGVAVPIAVAPQKLVPDRVTVSCYDIFTLVCTCSR